MNIAPARELRTGTIIEATLDVIERSAIPAVVFVVGLALANGAIAYFGLGYTSVVQELGKAAVAFVIAVVAAYLLFDAMLRQNGLLQPEAEDVILPYAALSILYTIAVGIGFLLIIFPGLYIMARWSVAQPLLIAQGKGVIASMKESWARTRGSEFAILVALLVLIILPVLVSYFVSLQLGAENPLGIAVAQVISAVSSMAGIAMGVALYRIIIADRDANSGKAFE